MPDRETAWAFLKDSDLIASAAEVQAAVQRVAGEIGRASCRERVCNDV